MGPIAHTRGWSGSRIWEPKLFWGPRPVRKSMSSQRKATSSLARSPWRRAVDEKADLLNGGCRKRALTGTAGSTAR